MSKLVKIPVSMSYATLDDDGQLNIISISDDKIIKSHRFNYLNKISCFLIFENDIYFSIKNKIYQCELNDFELRKYFTFKGNISIFDVQNNMFAIAHDSGKVVLFDLNEYNSFEVSNNNKHISSIRLDPAMNFLIYGYDSNFDIYQQKTLNFIKTIQLEYDHELEKINTLNILDNGNLISLNSKNKIIFICGKLFKKKFEINCFDLKENEYITSNFFLKGGEFILITTSSGKIFINNIINGNLYLRLNLQEIVSIVTFEECIILTNNAKKITKIKISLESIISNENQIISDDELCCNMKNFDENQKNEEKKIFSWINKIENDSMLNSFYLKYKYKCLNKFRLN